MTVEVFKTNVEEHHRSRLLIQRLLEHYPASKINFDLEDRDRILRVEGTNICICHIIELLKLNGHLCEVLT